MDVKSTVATHFKNMYHGPNLTGVNLNDILEGVDYKQATTQVYGTNSIALLLFHINYYVAGIIDVMKGGPLAIRDKYSFDMQPIESEAEWTSLKAKVLADVDTYYDLVDGFSEEKMAEAMADPKYGSWYKNLTGLIEHSHYHMGQIAILKKIVTHPDFQK